MADRWLGMRKVFKDAEFHREYKKLSGQHSDPLMPDEMEKAIREMPRDAEVIELLKNVSEEGPRLRDNELSQRKT
jgi:hypothetical protein